MNYKDEESYPRMKRIVFLAIRQGSYGASRQTLTLGGKQSIFWYLLVDGPDMS